MTSQFYQNGNIIMDDKPEVIVAQPDINLNNVNQNYSQVYSYSGQGRLHGFTLEFSNERVLTKLTIDGHVVFNIDCNIIDDIFGPVESSFPTDRWVNWERDNDLFHFNPRLPFKFNSNISIESKANNSSNFRYLARYVIEISKD